MACPEIECHKNQEGMRKTLYGADGKGGITACVQRKVSWTQLGSLILGLFVVGGVLFGGFALYAMEKQDAKYEKVEKCANENEKKIGVIRENIKQIKTDQGYIRDDVNEIRKDMVKKSDLDTKFDSLMDAIKKK